MKNLKLIATESETADTPPAKPKAAFNERPVKSAKDARRMLSRLISEFRAGEIEGTNAKTLCYLLQTYVNIQKDTEIEERILALEKAKGAA